MSFDLSETECILVAIGGVILIIIGLTAPQSQFGLICYVIGGTTCGMGFIGAFLKRE